jgi:hypothetical protein
MKRVALLSVIFGIAALVVAPAVQARVMSDDSAGGNAVVLQSDRIDGYGTSQPVPIRTDVLGGDGRPSDVVTWLDSELGKNPVTPTTTPISSSDESFPWDATLVAATLAGAMLLTFASLAVTRRRHRLSF